MSEHAFYGLPLAPGARESARSAFFAHTQIHEFKLSKRYIKTMNMDVISLGFPEQTIHKWLNGYLYEWVQEGLLSCHMRKKFDEVEFHNWKEVVSVNVGDRFIC